jgi:sugar O-acyltransferase (sialic acid O-acetyltransferase NeuD family)
MSKMSPVWIIGTGGFAKEVYFLIKSSTNFEVAGFIEKNLEEKESGFVKFFKEKIHVVDQEYFLSNFKKENVCVGVGNPTVRKEIHEKFKFFEFPNIIHKNAIFDSENIKIGYGNIVTAGCILTTCIEVGNLNVFNLNTTIGHDTKIGDYNVFNPSVNISGNCVIGSTNLFGVGSVILEKKVVGNNSVLGANSTLLSNMEDNVVYVGSPAKYKKQN